MNEYLLPIGSVVCLKGTKKPVMIYGVKQRLAMNPEVEIDYIAVPYPEGYCNEEYQYIFNQDDIEEVLFYGYEDELRDVFIQYLDSKL